MYRAEFDFVMFYVADLDSNLLKIQLGVYSNMFSKDGSSNTRRHFFPHENPISSSKNPLISEVCTLTKLVLVMLATNSVSEHSFKPSSQSDARSCDSLRNVVAEVCERDYAKPQLPLAPAEAPLAIGQKSISA